MHLQRRAVPGGADGVVPGPQERELREQEAGRHLQGRELLQQLRERGAVAELPPAVLRGLDAKGGVSGSGGSALDFRTKQESLKRLTHRLKATWLLSDGSGT